MFEVEGRDKICCSVRVQREGSNPEKDMWISFRQKNINGKWVELVTHPYPW